MPDYNLQGLNTRDFQHLIQALARKQISSGVNAFGDGKDGARDLTYQGKMMFPTLDTGWDGYLILSCKFNQLPSTDKKAQKAWVVQNIKDDFKKFQHPDRVLPAPEYYIFATNLALTGVEEIGGKDEVETLIKELGIGINLKGFDVWDYNNIRGFLDNNQDVRFAYGHFITAGDVLHQIVESLKFKGVDFERTTHLFLQKELIADAGAKLQSSSDEPGASISLANVFVGLPYVEDAEIVN